jgi:hypothetical protein
MTVVPVACTTVTPRLPSGKLGSVFARKAGGSTSSTMALHINKQEQQQ